MRPSTYKLLILLLTIATALSLTICQQETAIKISKEVYLKGGYLVVVDTVYFPESYTGSITFKYPQGWTEHINYTTALAVDGDYAKVSSITDDYIKVEVKECRQVKLYTVFSGVYVFRNRYAVTFIPLALAPVEFTAEVNVTIHYPTLNVDFPPEGFNLSGSDAVAYYGLVNKGTYTLLNTSFSYTDITWIVCYSLYRVITITDYSKAVIKDTYTLVNIGPRSESKIEFKLPRSAKIAKVAGVLGEYFEGARQGSYTVMNRSDCILLEVRFRHSIRGGEKIVLTIIYEVPLTRENEKYIIKNAFSSSGVYTLKSTVVVRVEGSLNEIKPEPSYKAENEAKYLNKVVPIADLLNRDLDIAVKFSLNVLKSYLPFIILIVFIIVLSAIGVAYVKVVEAKRPRKRPLFDQRAAVVSDIKDDVDKLYSTVERVESLTRIIRERKLSRRAFQVQKRGIEKDIESISENIKNKAKTLSEIDSRFSVLTARLCEKADEVLNLLKETLSLIDSFTVKRIKLKELANVTEGNISKMKRTLSTIEEIVIDMEDML